MESNKDILIGIDVGTQSLRACAFTSLGEKLSSCVVPFLSMTEPEPSYAEQDPLEWRDALYRALKEIAEDPLVDVDLIRAISCGCTTCTAVFLDAEERPVRPALMWMDHRAVQEAKEIFETHNPVLIHAGGNVSSEWMLPKLLWMKRHEPETLERTAYILEQTDYVIHLLSGAWTLSYCTMVAKWNYANPCGGWPDGFLEEIGLADLREKFPKKVCPVGTVVGTVSKELSEQTGIPTTVLVAEGGMDSTTGMLGLGACKCGQIGMSHGTSTVLQCQFDQFAPGLRGRPDALQKGMYLIGGGETSTGAVAQWFVKMLADCSGRDWHEYYGILEDQVAAIPPGSNGILVQEHFQGSRNVPDADSRGVIMGLTLWHSSAHILRAIYEGISFGVRAFLEQLKEVGYPLERICVGGGLVKSAISAQILADVCKLPIFRVTEKEHGALGAAIVAGWAAGLFKDFDDGILHMVKFREPVFPRQENIEAYDFYYEKYRAIYPATKDVIHGVVSHEREKISECNE